MAVDALGARAGAGASFSKGVGGVLRGDATVGPPLQVRLDHRHGEVFRRHQVRMHVSVRMIKVSWGRF